MTEHLIPVEAANKTARVFSDALRESYQEIFEEMEEAKNSGDGISYIGAMIAHAHASDFLDRVVSKAEKKTNALAEEYGVNLGG